MGVKQVIVMRKDLNMRKGKMAAQAAHASMANLLHYFTWTLGRNNVEGKWFTDLELRVYEGTVLDRWLLTETFKKICVSVDSEQELLDIYQKALDNGIPAALITDSGLTEFGGIPTKTCIAIGPDVDEKIDSITGHLKLL